MLIFLYTQNKPNKYLFEGTNSIREKDGRKRSCLVKKQYNVKDGKLFYIQIRTS